MPTKQLVQGGVRHSIPDAVLFCAHCRTPRGENELVPETNPESPVFGLLVCPEDNKCLEGTAILEVDRTYKAGPVEDFTPYDNTRILRP